MIPAALLSRLPLLMDGSPGDWLRQRHPGVAGPIEALNLRKPEWVQQAHSEFFGAGARVVRTSTRAASALALARHGLDDRCEAIHNSGAACVRKAIGTQAVLLGSIGEIGSEQDAASGLVAGLRPSLEERERAYGQQVVYLSDTGCDALLLEGFRSLDECLLVLRLARGSGDAPVLAVLALDEGGRTGDGHDPGTAAERLAAAGMDAVGLLCGPEHANLAELAHAARQGGLPVAMLVQAWPMALGQARPQAGVRDPLSIQTFARRLGPLAGVAALLGGGAGITPAHIKALSQALTEG
jgi:methionine synthase I (cobalamin-dependent)